jgi:hypothetical protein
MSMKDAKRRELERQLAEGARREQEYLVGVLQRRTNPHEVHSARVDERIIELMMP